MTQRIRNQQNFERVTSPRGYLAIRRLYLARDANEATSVNPLGDRGEDDYEEYMAAALASARNHPDC